MDIPRPLPQGKKMVPSTKDPKVMKLVDAEVKPKPTPQKKPFVRKEHLTDRPFKASEQLREFQKAMEKPKRRQARKGK